MAKHSGGTICSCSLSFRAGWVVQFLMVIHNLWSTNVTETTQTQDFILAEETLKRNTDEKCFGWENIFLWEQIFF